MLSPEQLACRVAAEASNGRTYRCGPGLPVSLAEHLRPEAERKEGPVQVLFVGADEVSGRGDLVLPSDAGECDFTGVERVIVVIGADEPGVAKIVRSPSRSAIPGVVHRIVSTWAVLDVAPEGLVVRQVAPGTSAREVQDRIAVPLLAGPDLERIPV